MSSRYQTFEVSHRGWAKCRWVEFRLSRFWHACRDGDNQITSIIFPINQFFSLSWQIGTNNCVARYRTLSGGIGGSPTPTHSSDYVDDEDDDNDEMTDNTAVLNGIASSSADCTNASTSTNVTKHLKAKQSNHSSHSSKASTISYQKASVHYVSDSIVSLNKRFSSPHSIVKILIVKSFIWKVFPLWQHKLPLLHWNFLHSQPNDIRNYPKELQKDNSISLINSNTNNRNFHLTSSESTKDDRSSISDQAYHCSASSVDSLPSASGSSELK